MGSGDLPVLGRCPVYNFPTHVVCIDTSWSHLLLRRLERDCILHDLSLAARNVSYLSTTVRKEHTDKVYRKQRTLEELDYIFGVPTKNFIAYNFRVALPWWWKRWVLFDKSAKLVPLYTFDGVEGHYQTGNENNTRRNPSVEKPEAVTREM